MRHGLLALALCAALAGLAACGAYYDGNQAMARGEYDRAIAEGYGTENDRAPRTPA